MVSKPEKGCEKPDSLINDLALERGEIYMVCLNKKSRLVLGILLVWVMTVGLIPVSQADDTSLGQEGLEQYTDLSAQDMSLYQDIFHLQESGQWQRADKLIARLENKLLMGHVEAQRYLHPTAYRSKYKELRRWLLSYSDHPQAERIYELAQKRRPANALNLQEPTGQYLSGSGYDATGFAAKTYAPKRSLNREDARKAAGYTRKMQYYTRKGWTKSVKALLNTKEVYNLLHPGQIDQARTWLAAGYYADGLDEWAYEWAEKAINKSGRYIPRAHWIAGLAAWRMEDRQKAITHFIKVTESDYSSDWMRSAGAFWAARSYLLEKQPENVNRWLDKAAHYPRTFYGLLAARALGYQSQFDWTVPELDQASLAVLRTNKAANRALALLALGKDDLAEREFRKAYAKSKNTERKTMLTIALHSNMPAFSMRLASQLINNGEENIPIAALYPFPQWEPKAGFHVDRALIFALMRQESGFNPNAKSYAGAKGLMQLMPGTASFVAGDSRFAWSEKLYEPETNIQLGQSYIQLLLDEDTINGDMFHMTAAWNGGPGNLNKWKKGVKHNNDPLLFIESIPSKETRNFIERVLSNFWIYRDRMGQDAITLDQIASGSWPKYQQQDQTEFALNAEQ